jgi:hypothetical protein
VVVIELVVAHHKQAALVVRAEAEQVVMEASLPLIMAITEQQIQVAVAEVLVHLPVMLQVAQVVAV